MKRRPVEPAKLKTSELLREAAGRMGDDALAFELRVRARWIEGARADEGVSHDRRMAIAAIEDVEVQP